MNGCLNKDIETWEGEGGAASGPPGPGATSMGGTAKSGGVGTAHQASGE
jgi:hypothetical protein